MAEQIQTMHQCFMLLSSFQIKIALGGKKHYAQLGLLASQPLLDENLRRCQQQKKPSSSFRFSPSNKHMNETSIRKHTPYDNTKLWFNMKEKPNKVPFIFTNLNAFNICGLIINTIPRHFAYWNLLQNLRTKLAIVGRDHSRMFLEVF